MKRLEGKTAIITGAAGGLGKHISILFAEQGANLALVDINENALKAVQKKCEEIGATVLSEVVDLSNVNDTEFFVNKVVSNFGGIDILLNLAIAIKPPHSFEEHEIATLDLAYQTGLVSTWNMMKFTLPHMKEKGGKIVNFGSGAGYHGQEGYAAYAAIKEGIRGLSRVIAREYGKYNINVNIVNPGALTDAVKGYLSSMPEEMQDPRNLGFGDNALGRSGDPYEDIAPVLLFLSTDDSRHLTGQTFHVDGGSVIDA